FAYVFFFFQAEDGIRDFHVTGVQTCALPISAIGKIPIGTLCTGGSRLCGTEARCVHCTWQWMGKRKPLRPVESNRRRPGTTCGQPDSRTADADRKETEANGPATGGWPGCVRRAGRHRPLPDG